MLPYYFTELISITTLNCLISLIWFHALKFLMDYVNLRYVPFLQFLCIFLTETHCQVWYITFSYILLFLGYGDSFLQHRLCKDYDGMDKRKFHDQFTSLEKLNLLSLASGWKFWINYPINNHGMYYNPYRGQNNVWSLVNFDT